MEKKFTLNKKNISSNQLFSIRRAEACILLYYMTSAVEFFTTKVGCSTFKALWSLSIGPALGMCLFTKISYQNKAPAGWVNKNHQLKPYSIAIYTLPHVCVELWHFCSKKVGLCMHHFDWSSHQKSSNGIFHGRFLLKINAQKLLLYAPYYNAISLDDHFFAMI